MIRPLGVACTSCAAPLLYVAGPNVLIVRCPGCSYLRTIAWNGPGTVIAHDWSEPVAATSDFPVADDTDEEQNDTDDRQNDADCDQDGERDQESHDDEDDTQNNQRGLR